MKNLDEIFNYRAINEDVATSGQPSVEQFHWIQQNGYELVIDLAPVDMSRYSIEDEPGLLANLGMDYIHIPVDFKNPLVSDFHAFCDAMETSENKKSWIHCAANYRVTVFYSLWAEQHAGWSQETSSQLIDSVWKSDPEWQMNEVWSSFIESVRTMMVA